MIFYQEVSLRIFDACYQYTWYTFRRTLGIQWYTVFRGAGVYGEAGVASGRNHLILKIVISLR